MKKTTAPRKKVLIIDDNAGILFALEQALLFDGYEVHASLTFKGAEAVSNISPDLIFLDIFLEGQDGREITKSLKLHHDTKDIPIIILSAYPGIEKLAKEAGADDYLAKPFELDALSAIATKNTA